MCVRGVSTPLLCSTPAFVSRRTANLVGVAVKLAHVLVLAQDRVPRNDLQESRKAATARLEEVVVAVEKARHDVQVDRRQVHVDRRHVQVQRQGLAYETWSEKGHGFGEKKETLVGKRAGLGPSLHASLRVGPKSRTGRGDLKVLRRQLRDEARRVALQQVLLEPRKVGVAPRDRRLVVLF